MKIAILGIDLQNDFTLPTGSLSVKNADEDVKRIASFIEANSGKIDYIALTLDSHQPIHIAHQIYWQDKNGNAPALFSTITAEDVRAGKWIARYNKDRALSYLEQLEEVGEVCTIWPMHCIYGTDGWAIDKTVMDSIIRWEINNDRKYELFFKGQSQSTEHYSIFKASVTWENEPETWLNTVLLDKLDAFDRIFLMGEAADICVANSLNDILNERPLMAEKIVILGDCMSWIYPDNKRASDIFARAKKMGAKFEKSTEYRL
jgi:nicotinamidase-related amidase